MEEEEKKRGIIINTINTISIIIIHNLLNLILLKADVILQFKETDDTPSRPPWVMYSADSVISHLPVCQPLINRLTGHVYRLSSVVVIGIPEAFNPYVTERGFCIESY